TNPEGALRRQQQVLALMVEAGYITSDQAAAAQAEMEARIGDLKPPRRDLPAPHFVAYVRQQLEAELGREALYRDVGLRVYTTLDPRLQALAEETLAAHRERLAQAGVDNAAIVVLRPDTGEILAMVGSLDFYDEAIDGQVNVALQPRQPGSSIKPLTYVKAFELGWTPATLIWDVRTEFPNGPNPPYVPKNYDDRFHGPVLVRDALGNSYNIPAVKALQFITVEGLKEMAARLGITTLTRNDYGLSLTLGGGEVKLLEMTGAYAVFANQGIRVPPTAIRRIEYADGTLYQEIVGRQRGGRVLDPRYAYLITDILADNQARCPAFGCPNLLELSRPAAVKTGTSGTDRDHVYDTWTIGYTPDLVVGVWAGNTDNRPIGSGMSGYQVATPIWHDFMEAALEGQPVRDFVRPEGIVEYEICADSGAMPTPYCPRRRREVFAQGQPPLDESHDFYQLVRIDAFTGLRANEFCQENVVEKVFLVLPEEGRKWVNETEAGRAWAEARGFAVPLEEPPEAECTAGTERPQVVITQPADGSTVVQGLVRVMGRVTMPNFDRYEVQYGVGMDPQGWGWISGPHLTPVVDGVLTEWDTRSLEPGTYT
ncbi:MAG: penicillin-binding protein, partial [Chloroflexi bacterium]